MESFEAPKSTALVQAQHKADQAAAKSAESKKKVEELKAKRQNTEKPPKDVAIQTKDNKKDGMVISIEAIKKPEGANKAQELKAMEEALKKATEEAHKQRIELTGEKDSTEASSLTQSTSASKSGL